MLESALAQFIMNLRNSVSDCLAPVALLAASLLSSAPAFAQSTAVDEVSDIFDGVYPGKINYVVVRCNQAQPTQSQAFFFDEGGTVLRTTRMPTGKNGCSRTKHSGDATSPAGPQIMYFTGIASSGLNHENLCDGRGEIIVHSIGGECATWCDSRSNSPTFNRLQVGVPVPDDISADRDCIINPYLSGFGPTSNNEATKNLSTGSWNNWRGEQIILAVDSKMPPENNVSCTNFHTTPRPNLYTLGCFKATNLDDMRYLCAGIGVVPPGEKPDTSSATQLYVVIDRTDLEGNQNMPVPIRNKIMEALGW